MITFCGQSPFDPMNGEYKMCFRGHFKKDHAHETGGTMSSRGCGSHGSICRKCAKTAEDVIYDYETSRKLELTKDSRLNLLIIQTLNSRKRQN